MRILGIDTSGAAATVAVTEEGRLLGEQTVYTSRTHSQVIQPMCKSLLASCDLKIRDVECFAVAVGPGSYTGLRIGIAAVQGMAMATGARCAGVSTLAAMAARLPFLPRVLVVLHARENKFYSALFRTTAGYPERLCEDALLSAEEIAALSEEKETVLTGSGAEALLACRAGEWTLAPEIFRHPSAAGVCLCAEHQTAKAAAALRPVYLRQDAPLTNSK